MGVDVPYVTPFCIGSYKRLLTSSQAVGKNARYKPSDRHYSKSEDLAIWLVARALRQCQLWARTA